MERFTIDELRMILVSVQLMGERMKRDTSDDYKHWFSAKRKLETMTIPIDRK